MSEPRYFKGGVPITEKEFDDAWEAREKGELAMSEPVDIVAEGRAKVYACGLRGVGRTTAELADTTTLLCDKVERLQALVEWHRVELAKQIERTNTMSAEIETYKRMFED